MSIEDNMKIVSGLRRMGVMGHEVEKLEAMIAEGKTNAEIADAFACDESVVEGFRKGVEGELKTLEQGGEQYPAPPEDEVEEDHQGKGRGKRK